MGSPIITSPTGPLPVTQVPPPATKPPTQPAQSAPPAPPETINTNDQSTALPPGAPTPIPGSPAAITFPPPAAGEQADPPRPQLAVNVSGYAEAVIARNEAARPATPGGTQAPDTGSTTIRAGVRRESLERLDATDTQGGFINRDRANLDVEYTGNADGSSRAQATVGISFSDTRGNAGSQAAMTELDQNARRPERR